MFCLCQWINFQSIKQIIMNLKLMMMMIKKSFDCHWWWWRLHPIHHQPCSIVSTSLPLSTMKMMINSIGKLILLWLILAQLISGKNFFLSLWSYTHTHTKKSINFFSLPIYSSIVVVVVEFQYFRCWLFSFVCLFVCLSAVVDIFIWK